MDNWNQILLKMLLPDNQTDFGAAYCTFDEIV